MSSVDSQFLDLKYHREHYPDIDPRTALKGSAAGKTVFISGAPRGIGLATAVAFAQAGAKAVYITARSEKDLETAKSKITMANPETKCAYSVCDVTDEDQVKAAVEGCVKRFGGMDVVDTNAGYLDKWKKIGESDVSSWWYSWEVNIKGTYLVARYTIPHLIESAKEHSEKGSTGGHLILISSVGAQLLMPGASD